MQADFTPFVIFLSLLWFLVYWILGGVFFAAITIIRLGRLRKVRFSCLFTILAVACGIGAADWGLRYSQEAVDTCIAEASNKAEMVTAIFGCGFAGVFGMFMLGAIALTLGGFLIMFISQSKSKPWIDLNPLDEGIDMVEQDSDEPESKFF